MTDELFTDISKYLKAQNDEEAILFTAEEYEQLILSFLDARGEDGAGEDEIIAFIKECEVIRAGETLIQLAFKGLVHLDFKDGEIFASRTELGNDVWKSLQ